MKKLSILMLALITMPTFVQAQSMLSTLSQYQETLKTPSSGGPQTSGGVATPGSNINSKPDVKPSSGSVSSSSSMCTEKDQTSLPLAYVISLIQEKNAKLDLVHDPRAGTLAVTAADMIGNCSSMLEWRLKQPEIQGQKAYAIEVAIKEGKDCSPTGCRYDVAKVKNGEFQDFEPMNFKPTLKGFEECLQKSGVVENGKVVPGAIYNAPIKEKFSGLEHSGKILFLAHGPSSNQVKPKYALEYVDSCDRYETAHPQIKTLLTFEDAEKERLDAEASKLKECKVDEYHKLADFIEKYETYSMELGDIRDRLILEAAKKAAVAVQSGKYTEEDLKVLSDFERYIVTPKVELANSIYDQMIELEGDAKKAKQEELRAVLSQIKALKQKPYFTAVHTRKLLDDGRFEEAEKLNGILIVMDAHQNLGSKQNNMVMTPSLAAQKVASGRAMFKEQLEAEKERYEYKTGQSSGKADYYNSLAQRMRSNIQVRTQNFTAEIQSEYQRVQQPNGYCYKYWRNAQKCIQDTAERVQELQALLAHYNKVDTERASEYDAKAKEYAELEAQGRRYVAAQNGEEVPVETAETTPTPEVDTVSPTPRAQDNHAYTFNYNQGPGVPQQQAQMTPQQYQYPVNPYQQQNMFMQPQNPYMNQQRPVMGQQAYGQYGYPQQQGGYSFNWSGGAGMQQQQPQNPYMYNQQQGYWQQPYQSYNMYSMYGR